MTADTVPCIVRDGIAGGQNCGRCKSKGAVAVAVAEILVQWHVHERLRRDNCQVEYADKVNRFNEEWARFLVCKTCRDELVPF